MKLLLDIGNSTINSAMLGSNGELVSPTSQPHNDLTLNSIISENITEIWVSNVAGEAMQKQIIDWSTEHNKLTPHFIIPSANAYGIQLSYAKPSNFGTDRWLALIAAREQSQQAVCVIDCGTAITVDWLDANGKHLGGAIAPGLAIMQTSLANNTDRCQTDSANVPSFDLTAVKNTAQAITTGCTLMVSGYLNALCLQAREKLGATAEIYLTGGDAHKLLSYLTTDVIYQPHLVLQGLAIIACDSS